MSLPSTGSITMAQVAAELGISAVGLSLNDSRVRALAGKPSGPISFGDLRGKSAASLVSSLSVVLSNVVGTSGIRSVSATFANDGSISTVSGSGSTQWYNPSVSGIGGSYYIKFVPNGTPNSTTYGSGTAPSTWYPMTSGKTFTFQNSGINTEGTGNAAVYISTAGTDASIVASYTGSALSWDVGRAV